MRVRVSRPATGLPEGPSGNNCTILDADASRRASLLVAYIPPVCAVLAPRRAGASTPRDCAFISGRTLPARGPLLPLQAEGADPLVQRGPLGVEQPRRCRH